MVFSYLIAVDTCTQRAHRYSTSSRTSSWTSSDIRWSRAGKQVIKIVLRSFDHSVDIILHSVRCFGIFFPWSVDGRRMDAMETYTPFFYDFCTTSPNYKPEIRIEIPLLWFILVTSSELSPQLRLHFTIVVFSFLCFKPCCKRWTRCEGWWDLGLPSDSLGKSERWHHVMIWITLLYEVRY